MNRGWLGSIVVVALAAVPVLALPGDGTAPYAGPQPQPTATDAGPANVFRSPASGCPAPVPPFPGPPSGDGSPGAFDPPGPEPCESLPPFASIEYLNWWVVKHLPPLVTSNPNTAGILGQQDTQLLFGGTHENEENHTGARATACFFFKNAPLGCEVRAEFLGERATRFTAGSNDLGEPGLSRPIVNALTGQETAQIISFPGQFVGHVQASSETFIWSGETNALVLLDPERAWPCLIVGGRYLDVEESLSINQQSTAIGSGLVGMNGQFLGPGTQVTINDHFTTRNQFIGGQLGAQGRLDDGHVFLKLRGTLAVGTMFESATISGGTTFASAAGSTTVPGGLLALPTNIGHFTHEEVSLVPEGEVAIGAHLGENVEIFLGYNILYISDVLRPVEGMDRAVNPTQLPTSVQGTGLVGVPRPGPLRDTDFFAHGLSLGLALQY
jgi:hypothetical protein